MTDLKNLTNQEMCEYRCAECKHACFEWEDYAYYGGVTQYVSYIADCKKIADHTTAKRKKTLNVMASNMDL